MGLPGDCCPAAVVLTGDSVTAGAAGVAGVAESSVLAPAHADRMPTAIKGSTSRFTDSNVSGATAGAIARRARFAIVQMSAPAARCRAWLAVSLSDP